MLFTQSGHSAAKFIMLKILRLEWKGTKKNKKPRPVMIGADENVYSERAGLRGCGINYLTVELRSAPALKRGGGGPCPFL